MVNAVPPPESNRKSNRSTPVYSTARQSAEGGLTGGGLAGVETVRRFVSPGALRDLGLMAEIPSG